MQIGVIKESGDESRVAVTPNTVTKLQKLGFSIAVEHDAGMAAGFDDQAYEAVGATLASHQDILNMPLQLRVNPPTDEDIAAMAEGITLISFLAPAQTPERIQQLADKRITAMSMEMVPRISRAQSMDALSSMANISGYRAVVEAANAFGRFFTGQITAAGKVPPAEVLVIGAGVAGLAAIGSARALGAVVKAFDTREEVAEQIESMGAQFLRLDYEEKQDDNAPNDGYAKEMSQAFIDAEMALFAEQAKQVDIIITTAAIPGKKSPLLITEDMVKSMKRGSVIVDLAAAGGGNCALTEAGKKIVTENGVIIIGYTDLASRLAGQSSQLYATNLVNLLKLMTPNKDGNINVDFEDVVLRNMTICKNGDVTYPPPKISVSAKPAAAPTQAAAKAEPTKRKPSLLLKLVRNLAVLAFIWLLMAAPLPFVQHMMVFTLSVVIGYYVVWNVTHSLHTPLMSVTNAISGIVIVGALLQIGHDNTLVTILSFIAVLLASINIFGGFAVTRRMLNMFRKEH